MMRKIIVPVQFIMVMVAFVFSSYAEQPREKITNSLGMELVLIQPGQFIMGSPQDEPGRYSGEKAHRVNLTKPFYLQTTEVTQGQWQALTDKNPSSHKHCGDNCPVEQVSFKDAQQFIRKLNRNEPRVTEPY